MCLHGTNNISLTGKWCVCVWCVRACVRACVCVCVCVCVCSHSKRSFFSICCDIIQWLLLSNCSNEPRSGFFPSCLLRLCCGADCFSTFRYHLSAVAACLSTGEMEAGGEVKVKQRESRWPIASWEILYQYNANDTVNTYTVKRKREEEEERGKETSDVIG